MNAQFFANVHVMKCQCGSNTFRHHLTYQQLNTTDTVVKGVTDACANCGIAYVREYVQVPAAKSNKPGTGPKVVPLRGETPPDNAS